MKKVIFATFYYNRSNEIDVTLKSMLLNTHNNTKILVVDDGSTDNTREKLALYKSENIDVISHENKGLSKSMFELFKNIDSEYIAICGSGDISYPERIKKQVAILDSRPDIAFCGTASSNIDAENGNIIDIQSYREGELEKSDFINSPPFTHGTVMIRTEAYNLVGGYDPKFYFCQDWDLWLRLLKVGKGYFINEKLYDRRVLLDGASFNAKKAELQLVYKYLALTFNENENINRDEYLENFEINNIIEKLNLKYKLRKDISSRFVKLVLIRQFSDALELRKIANERYGGIETNCLIVYYIIFIPAKLNFGLTLLSRLLRFSLNFFRNFNK